jgi:hypothetical protein
MLFSLKVLQNKYKTGSIINEIFGLMINLQNSVVNCFTSSLDFIFKRNPFLHSNVKATTKL